MVIFDIRSIGDQNFLVEVLNSIAIMTGSGVFTTAVKISMLLGILFIAFQSVSESGKSIDFQKTLIAWVVYMLLFGWTATVNVYDTYKGPASAPVPVANVPGGIAAAGSFISMLGYYMTSDMEQFFSLPKMTADGFGRDIDFLMLARAMDTGTADNALNTGTSKGTSIKESITSYLANCTALKTKGEMKAFKMSADPLMDMKYNTGVYSFIAYFPSTAAPTVPPAPAYTSAGRNLPCDTGHTELVNAIRGTAFGMKFKGVLAMKMGLKTAGQAYPKMQSALDAMTGVGHDAHKYMEAALIKEMLPRAIGMHMMNGGSPAAATIKVQAVEQKRILDAAQSSLFMRYVRPLMTFVEGFVYAISPLIGILVVSGTMGMGLAAKYVLIILWIQLWMPVLAIVNLYLNMSVHSKMTALSSTSLGNLDPTSLWGQAAMHATMADWVSTAGVLAAATPALSLMLIYGSAVTATNLSGKLGEGNTVDPKTAAPDLLKNGPDLDYKADNVHDPMTGTARNGENANVPTLTTTQLQASQVASSAGAVSTAQASLGKTLNETLGKSQSGTHSVTVGDAVHKIASTTGTETNGVVKAGAESSADSLGLKGEQKTAFLTALSGGVDGSYNNISRNKIKGMGKAGVKLGANLQSMYGDQTSYSADQVYAVTHTATQTAGYQANYAKAMTHDLSASDTKGNSDGWTAEKKQQVAQQYQKVFQANQQYVETASDTSSTGEVKGGKISTMVGNRAQRTGGKISREDAAAAKNLIERTFDTSNGNFNKVAEKYKQVFAGQGNVEEKAAWGAALEIAGQHANDKDPEKAQVLSTLMNDNDWNNSSDDGLTPTSNQDLNNPTSSVQQHLKNTPPPTNPANEVQEKVDQHGQVMANGAINTKTADKAVRNEADQKLTHAKQEAARQEKRENMNQANAMITRMNDKNNNKTLAQRGAEGANFIGTVGKHAVQEVTDKVVEGAYVVASTSGVLQATALATYDFLNQAAHPTDNGSENTWNDHFATRLKEQSGWAGEQGVALEAAKAGEKNIVDYYKKNPFQEISEKQRDELYNEGQNKYFARTGQAPQKAPTYEMVNKAMDQANIDHAHDMGLTPVQAELYAAKMEPGQAVSAALGNTFKSNRVDKAETAFSKEMFDAYTYTDKDKITHTDTAAATKAVTTMGAMIDSASFTSSGTSELMNIAAIDKRLGLTK